VDDDRDVRELLVESFRLAGFEVLAAANGLEALLYVKREPPDAVVLDLMMPRLGGVEALKRIRSFNPGIRVLVVTGNIDPELQRQATAAGAAGGFTKPPPAAPLGPAPARPAPRPAPARAAAAPGAGRRTARRAGGRADRAGPGGRRQPRGAQDARGRADLAGVPAGDEWGG